MNGGYANAVSNFVSALCLDEQTFVKVLTPTPLEQAEEVVHDNLQVLRLPRYHGRIRYKSIVDQLLWVRHIRHECLASEWDFCFVRNP